jgi:conjugative relaxase-like TrwC/TraI family protein
MVCKVEPGTSADYCIEEQAEYHLGGREPNGHWYMPGGQFSLVNGAEIDNLIFRQLHAGEDPLTGEQIGKTNAEGERVCGYDAQFGAPKSVSVLWALSDSETRAKIESIQERAVRAALDFAQQHAAQIRTGHDGVEIEKTTLLGATFQHGESRPTEREDGSHRSDPQLHTHAILFNLGQGADGKWRALDGRPLMAMQKAMGAQYHAEMARLLEAELGVQVDRHELAEERHNGEFEIRGVPKDLVDQFSTRRQQIEAAMAAHGMETRDSAALAGDIALATRGGKTSESREEQLARWTAEAAEAGWAWGQISSQTFGQILSAKAVAERDKAYEASLQELTGRLTEHESVFTEAELYAAIAAAGSGRGHGAVDVAAVEQELLASGQIVELATDEKGQPVYSTAEMVGIERDIRDIAASQAAMYPPAYKEEDKSHVRATNPGKHDRAFDAATPISKLDAAAPAAGSAAEKHGVRGVSRGAVGRDDDVGAVLLPREADLQLDDRKSAGEDSLRRPAVRTAGTRVAPHTLRKSTVDAYVAARAAGDSPPTSEQVIGLHWIAQHGGSHVVIEGGAGTGKTKVELQGAADLYGADGYDVLATAPKWITALDLAKIKVNGELIDGLATAKLLADYDAGNLEITDKALIMVDEAGQMGSRDFHRLMAVAEQTGCRIIWTGDRLQQKAVAAGDPLSIMAKELGSHRLKESQRMLATAADVIAYREKLPQAFAHQWAKRLSAEEQAELVERYGKEVEAVGAVWARQAATDFSEGRAAEALTAFREHDQLVWADTADEALECAVQDWAAFKAENPDLTAIVSAARHSQTRELNARMREHLRSIGQIGEDMATVKAIAANGDKFDLALAIGDQVRLGANLKDLDLYNGMVGIVRDIQKGSKPGHPYLTIDMETPEGVRQIKIETQRLANDGGPVRLAHGYAQTNAIIQGDTQSALFGQISSRDSSNSSYVVGSRARHFTKLYAAREFEDIALKRRLNLSERPGATFTDQQRDENLARALSRAQVKKSTLDYEKPATAEVTPAEAVLAATADLAAERQGLKVPTEKQEMKMERRTVRQVFEQAEKEARDSQKPSLAAVYRRVGAELGAGEHEYSEIYEASIRTASNPAEALAVMETMRAVEQKEALAEIVNRRAAVRNIETVSMLAADDRVQMAEPPASRQMAHEATTPAGQLEAYFGRPFASDLVNQIRSVELQKDAVTLNFADQSEIHHEPQQTTHHGHLTDAKAALMAEMLAAEGHESVRITGSMVAKEKLARACFDRGMTVINEEMKDFVEQLQREKQLHQKTASTKAEVKLPTQARQQSREASAGAMRMLEAGRLARELPNIDNPIEKFVAANRLAELVEGTDSQGKAAIARTTVETAAAAIMKNQDLMAEAQAAGVLEDVAEVYEESEAFTQVPEQSAEAEEGSSASEYEYED